MATIKGLWKINSVGTVSGVIQQDVNGTSGGLTFERIQVWTGYVSLHDAYSSGVALCFDNNVPVETYQILDFGEAEQTVDDKFYNWLMLNATGLEYPEPEEPETPEDPEDPDTGGDGNTDTGGDDSGDTGTGDSGDDNGDTGSGGTDDGDSGETEDTDDISEIEVCGRVFYIKDKGARMLIENLGKRVEVYEKMLSAIEQSLATI